MEQFSSFDRLSEPDGPKEFSVSEISNRIKFILEDNFGNVRIKGEISGFKQATSGHAYFSLKDSHAVLSATIWRHSLAKVNFKITEGLEVVVTGKITAYGGQSKYQISATHIEPYGVGAFMQILTERKKKFQAEGLFSPQYKKPIPFMPKIIGVITSQTGAVIRDIIHRIEERCPTHIIIWPVAVQGEKSASEVEMAINGFNKFKINRPDLLIVARGGGSIEDLWSFNEENVVRAAFGSEIPIISAIGHETDYCLLDLVADKRAPTPTAAAEFASPVKSDLQFTANQLGRSLYDKANAILRRLRERLDSFGRLENYPQSFINSYIQRLDDLGFRLSSALPNLLKYKATSLQQLAVIGRLIPSRLLLECSSKLENASYRLQVCTKNNYLNSRHKLEVKANMLSMLSYKKVLARGYAMLTMQDGSIISSASMVKGQNQITAKMHDGTIHMQIKETKID